MGKEHALLIPNHKSDIDWLIGWVLAQRSGCLDSLVAVAKKSSKLLPGFVTSVKQLRSFVPAIYDITVAIPKNSPPPTMLRLFKGQTSVVHVKVKRHLMIDLPETDEEIAQWCKELFVAKDDLLEKHKTVDAFPDSEPHDLGRPLKSLVVETSWASLLVFGSIKFIQWSNLFSSWMGVTITALCLAVVAILMQMLIQSSQSERSTPAKVAPLRNSSDEGLMRTKHDKKQ